MRVIIIPRLLHSAGPASLSFPWKWESHPALTDQKIRFLAAQNTCFSALSQLGRDSGLGERTTFSAPDHPWRGLSPLPPP
jgi:hypothetical protein